ncbi:MAG: TetR/AcrR family transcriptional regulator [Caldilineaceae bacterium]|jgi:AcrR family transcriptional regulator|nr:TetR/AcrR family transcriptional regulator [Caldilineaceae bacterium]
MVDEPLRKGEATQARILDAAYSLFMEQGYHGTSMRQIVERAGITTGGVYNHFASKEEIWIAVLLQRHPYRDILPVLSELNSATLEEYVRNAAQRLVGELNKQQDLLHITLIELVEFNGVHILQLYERIAPELRPLAALLNKYGGELRPISPPLLARTFLGFFFSYYITEAMMPAQVRALMGADALDAFVDIYLHGVLAGGEGRGASSETSA